MRAIGLLSAGIFIDELWGSLSSYDSKILPIQVHPPLLYLTIDNQACASSTIARGWTNDLQGAMLISLLEPTEVYSNLLSTPQGT